MACDTMKEIHQQMGKDMNLLFVIDDAYVEQLKVVLYSIVQQMPKQAFQVFLMQQVLLKKHSEIKRFVENLGMTYHPIVVGEDAFASAPTDNVILKPFITVFLHMNFYQKKWIKSFI